MDSPEAAPARHTPNLAGRLAGLAVFIGCTAIGVRNLLLEPRISAFDGALWLGLVLMGLVLCLLTVATLLGRPLLGLSPELGTTVRLVPNYVAVSLAGLSLGPAMLFHRWQVAAANALVIAAGAYCIRRLPPQPSPTPPSPVGPAA